MNIASRIDHTLLRADSRKEEIEKLCQEAKDYKFASVCVNPSYVELCAELLKGTGVKLATVIGFPLGATSKEVKAFETREALAKGANEFDMVINIAALKNGDYNLVREDIEEVVGAAGRSSIVKVIIETCLLTEEEKIMACQLAKEAGADFVKTSTGFSKAGAQLDDIRLMRATIGEDMKIKASGGIRDLERARKMVEAGADRIGASASVQIAEDEVK